MSRLKQRGGVSSVFDPSVRGGSFNFQLPMGGGSYYGYFQICHAVKIPQFCLFEFCLFFGEIVLVHRIVHFLVYK